MGKKLPREQIYQDIRNPNYKMVKRGNEYHPIFQCYSSKSAALKSAESLKKTWKDTNMQPVMTDQGWCLYQILPDPQHRHKEGDPNIVLSAKATPSYHKPYKYEAKYEKESERAIIEKSNKDKKLVRIPHEKIVY